MTRPGDLVLSIVIPASDEGLDLATLARILDEMVDLPHEVLVIAVGENERHCAEVAAVVARHRNLTLAAERSAPSVLEAIRAGAERSTGRYVLIYAPDEVGPVLAIEDMLDLMDGGCDLVSTTRYAYGGRRLGGSLASLLLSRFANALYRRLGGSVLTDATSGVKMFRRPLLERLELSGGSSGWVVTFELAMKSEIAGCILGEVPVVSIDRLYGGRASEPFLTSFTAYLRWFAWGIRRLRSRPRNVPAPGVRLAHVKR